MYFIAEYDHVIILSDAHQRSKLFAPPGPANRVVRITDNDRFGIDLFTKALVSRKINAPVTVFVTNQITAQRHPVDTRYNVKKIMINGGENNNAFTRSRDSFKHQHQRA